jgi:hypothetical protein
VSGSPTGDMTSAPARSRLNMASRPPDTCSRSAVQSAGPAGAMALVLLGSAAGGVPDGR